MPRKTNRHLILEILVSLLPATILTPIAIAGVCVGYNGLVLGISCRDFPEALALCLLGLGGLLGTLGLWIAVPFKTQKLVSLSWIRFSVFACLIAGSLSAASLFIVLTSFSYPYARVGFKEILFLLGLVGPILVAARYIYLFALEVKREMV
jgi:hypothetical protein